MFMLVSSSSICFFSWSYLNWILIGFLKLSNLLFFFFNIFLIHDSSLFFALPGEIFFSFLIFNTRVCATSEIFLLVTWKFFTLLKVEWNSMKFKFFQLVKNWKLYRVNFSEILHFFNTKPQKMARNFFHSFFFLFLRKFNFFSTFSNTHVKEIARGEVMWRFLIENLNFSFF